jgi:microcystin-dependent protein
MPLTAYDGTDGDAAIAATATNVAATATNQSTGGGGAHNNLQPYMILNFIIKT